MATLTVQVGDELKTQVQKRLKNDGINLTFLITQMMLAYNTGKISFGLSVNSDDDIVAEYDVSTPAGVQSYLDSLDKL